MGRLVGIDLGTTNSCVAVLQGGSPTIIHTRQGERTLPSIVAFTEDGELLVGDVAKRQAVTNPARTIVGVKRLIGHKLEDQRLDRWKKGISYSLVAADNGDAWVRVGDKSYSPQEISSFVLEELISMAADYLGDEVDGAVITVPAHFDESQRQATKDAAAIAGVDVKKIINEPTAAALAYGVGKVRDETFAVFDLGGGTFDITILRTAKGVFEILATNGDTFLGGDDFDLALMQHLTDDFAASHQLDLSEDPQATRRLKEAAEQAKKELSNTIDTMVQLPYISVGPDGPVHLQHDRLERGTLELLTLDLLDRLERPCLDALDAAGVKPENLNRVLLVGGMTRMPAVQRRVEQIFGIPPSRDLNPDEIVAQGAAVQCAVVTGEIQEIVLLDVTPHSLGVKVKDGRMSVIIEKNTTVPTSEKRVFSTTESNQERVHIEVYQGEDELTHNNTLVGRFTLHDLPKGKAGQVNVAVTFMIDADGTIDARAREIQTGREASIRIHPSSGLTDSQFERIVKDHEINFASEE